MSYEVLANDQIQYFATAPGATGSEADTLLRITEDTAFDPKVDLETYDPKYKDRTVQPSNVLGEKATYDYDIDHNVGSPMQEALYAIEDERNVPGKVMRVDMFKKQGEGFAAKMSDCSWTPNPIDAKPGEPINHTGICTRTGAWIFGIATLSADMATATFVPLDED